MGKIILHVVCHMEPDTKEFDEIRDAVGFAIEGMHKCDFAIDRITDGSGKTLLTEEEILEYEYR